MQNIYSFKVGYQAIGGTDSAGVWDLDNSSSKRMKIGCDELKTLAEILLTNCAREACSELASLARKFEKDGYGNKALVIEIALLEKGLEFQMQNQNEIARAIYSSIFGFNNEAAHFFAVLDGNAQYQQAANLLLKAAADSGRKVAQFAYAQRLHKGEAGLAKDPMKAAYYYKESFHRGYPPAKEIMTNPGKYFTNYQLSLLYTRGEAFVLNPEIARHHLALAVKENDPEVLAKLLG